MAVITRKVELNFNSKDKDEIKFFWETWFNYQKYTFKAANLIASHCFFQQQVKEFFYFTEEMKLKLDNIKKDESGVLNTSKRNSTYQVASRKFLEHLPGSVLTCLNSVVYSTYNSEYKEMMMGKRSLRSYRFGMPIPFQINSIKSFQIIDEFGNFGFTLFKTPFKTFFGKDKSGNKKLFNDAIINVKHKLCDSSIQIKNKKIFLLAVFKIEDEKLPLDKDKVCEVEFDVNAPVQCRVEGKKKWFIIGDNDILVEQRKKIRYAYYRQKKISITAKSGKGRKRKLKSCDRFLEKEKNFISHRIHQFTYRIVKFAIQNNCGTIVVNPGKICEEDPEKLKFLLSVSNTSMIKEKLYYKCNRVGIDLIFNEKEDEETNIEESKGKNPT